MCRSRRLGAVLLVLAGGTATGQSEQPDAPLPVSIRNALSSLETGTGPSQSVQLTGVLSSEPVANNFGEIFAFLQDSTAGISIVFTAGQLFSARFQRGDVLTVRGKPRRSLGTDQILVTYAQRIDSTPPPVPSPIRVADAWSGRYSGKLVVIEGEVLPVGQPMPIRLRDSTGTIIVAGPVEVPLNRDVLARCVEGGHARITGVIAARSDNSQSKPVVRIYTRDPVDFQFAPMPPYRAILLSILGSAVVWAFVYLVLGRRRAERRASESESRFRAIFDHTFQFIGLLKTDGTLLEANRTALEFAGVSEKDVMGKPFWETPWFSHSRELQDQLRQAIRTAADGDFVRMEVLHPDSRGALHNVDFSLKPLLDENGKVTLLIPEGRDITQRKRAEAEREKLQTQLIQSQKMESVGRLAGGVAHDFNNLLTVINGYTTLGLSGLTAGDPLRDRLHRVLEAGERAAALTQQLLAYSRRQVLRPRAIELNSVAVRMHEMLARIMGDDVEVHLNLLPDKIFVFADPHQLEQAIMNLATNARDAMPNGGRFCIGTAVSECQETDAAPEANPHSKLYAVLTLSDTGSGMDEATRQRIFEPFFSTKETGKGTGLGLAMVHGMVTQSGGHIHVDSAPGMGSTFRICLPLGEGSGTESANSPAIPAAGGEETILVVEDRPEVRDYITVTLQSYGYTTLAASDAAEAVTIFERDPDKVHLVLTDVVMPGISGVDLATRLAGIRHGVKILFMSGYSDEIVVRRGGLDHARFIRKPFTPEELAQKVREVLGLRS